MSDLNALLDGLPINQIAAQLGEDPEAVRAAASQALPTLVGGLQQNAQDPDGAQSLATALGDHDPSLITGGIDLDDVNTADGEKIAQHILGSQPQQFGGVSDSLVKKLIPILAPIVMAWLMQQVQNRAGGASQQDTTQQDTGQQDHDQQDQGGIGGVIGDILGRVLGGGQSGTQGTNAQAGGGMQQILLDILGQALRSR